MLAMEVESAVAANATTENVYQGQRFERMPFNGKLTILHTGSAAGLRAEYNVGGRSVTPRLPVNLQNRQPIPPDDTVVEDVYAFAGELIQATVANTTAGALTFRGRVLIEPT